MAYENWLNPRQAKLTQNTYKLDVNKTPEQNIVDIILGLYIRKHDHNEILLPRNASKDLRTGFRGLQRNVPDGRRLAYFNALVNLLYKENKNHWGFTTDELMTCVRISLVDDSPVVRVAALRVLRYLIKTESDVGVFNTLKLPYLVVRAMDMVRNEEERAQALRVVRRVISVLGASQQRRQRAAYVDIGLLRCLVAAARAGGVGDGTGDRLARPAVATLAEIGVLNAELFISCGGVNAVSRQLMECATPRMAEALCGVLLHLLNDPTTRRLARVDLSCLCASYCDFHIRPSGVDTNRDEREMRFTCSRLALVCVLRSWPGVLHFCHPANSGGLRALVAALRLPRLHVRKAIMDLLYELVGLPQPEWTDEISVALSAVDPSDFQDAWRLNEGFVAAEGAAILPHLSTTGPDIVEIHLALLLQCFLEAGLLDSLAEVIVTSDTFISVRATVLLGQLLHLIHLFLPPQICSVTPTLPALMSGASAGRPQALAAVQALRTHHALLDARPATTSLFLDHIIQYCTGAFREKEDTTKSRKEKDNANMAKPKDIKNSIEFLNDSDENEPKQRHSVGSRADVPTRNVSALVKSKSVSSRTSAAVSKVTKTKLFGLFDRESDNLIRCTLVMQNKDGNTWNWEIIRTILKESDSAPLLNLNDSSHKAWVSRIVNYLKPSSNKFSHQDLSTSQGLAATRAGCQLIRHLLRHNDADSQRLLEDLFYDVSRQIEAIETGVKAHECLFSPQHMSTTNCQMYFLFIGQLCHTQTGLSLFKQTRLHENLIELSTKTHHTCYVKLIITSLNYTLDSHPREILAKTLTCSNQASKLYATQFLHVLLRASRKSKDLVRRKSKLKKNIEQLRAQKEEAESNGVDMETWILQLLVSQIKDDYKAVVKSALSILEEAYSVPAFVDKLVNMRDALCQSCHLDKNADPATLDFSAVGDRGYLIWLGLEVAALAQTSDAKAVAFVKKHLDFWTRSYNYRYARLVDSGVHEALTLSCRSRVRRAARPPPHLQAALAARRPALLADTLPALARTLQRKKCATEQDIMDLKASLWAIGNIAMTSQGFQLLMNLTNGYEEDSVAAHIVKLATYCPVYSVRATAFYVLGLIATTYEGANLLSELGWLCVRHTRHEQFPVIPDETYLFDSNVPNYITSPDKKLNAFDVELSEHSDHTDQSMIDSTHIEIKHTKTGSTSDELKEMDVVDYKTNESRSDKRKSHTLPSQSCSTSHERPTLSESRTVDIIRDCTYERPIAYPRAENRLLIGRMNSLEHAHEGRVRNTSESSTSGVSSCDSFLGKYAIPDRVLTLSPIPSSSSLQGMKGSSSAQRPKISDLQRRTSTSSFTTSEIASSPPGHLDMTGYATLKSLNKHRRPHLSESAASASDMEDISWLLTDTNRRSKPFSSLRDRAKSTRERMAKLSLLDYDWKPLSLGEARQSPPPPARAPRRPPPPPAPHPAGYIGIALPSNLAELFPREEVKKIPEDCMKYVSDAPRRRLPSSMVDSSTASDKRASPDSQKLTAYKYSDVRRSAATYVANNIGASTSALISRTTGAVIAANRDAFASSGSSVSTVTQTPGNFKALSRVTEGAELTKVTTGEDSGAVSDATVNNVDIKKPEVKLESDKTQKTNGTDAAAGGDYKIEVTGNVSTASDAGTSSSRTSGMRANVSNVSETGTASSITVGKTAKSEPASEGNSQHKPEQWKHATADCLACVPTRPPSSHELREAFLSGVDPRTSTSPVPERSPQAELLHHVYFMSNPIHLRQTRSALLSLKQSHPEIFRSPCVYSDVCALLSGDTYMLCARRFVQELFCETCFECFIPEPREILLRHGVVPTSRTPSPEQQNEAGKREPGGPKGPIGPQPGPSGSQNEQTGPQRGRAGSQNDKTGQQRGRAGSQNDPTGTLRKSIAETQETKAELQAEPRAKVEPKTNNQSEQDKSQAVPQTKRQSGSSRDSKVEPHFDIQSLPKPGPFDE